jgi:hypothetical protein
VDAAGNDAFLAAAALYALAATWLLARGRGGRLLGVAVLTVYAAWLLYASKL